jgi:hypothetical protein
MKHLDIRFYALRSVQPGRRDHHLKPGRGAAGVRSIVLRVHCCGSFVKIGQRWWTQENYVGGLVVTI